MPEELQYGRRSYDAHTSEEIDKLLLGSDEPVHRAILVILQKVEASLSATNTVMELQSKRLDEFHTQFTDHDVRETKDRATLIGAKATAQWFIGGYAALLVVILSLGGVILSEYRLQLMDLRAVVDVLRVEQARHSGADR